MPQPKKHASVRARRNKASTARTLTLLPHDIEAPALPSLADGEEWHPLTRVFWADIWASPMAPEWHDSDRHGLALVARLVDEAHKAESLKDLKDAMTELRLQRQCFGLTPYDRRRLEWAIEEGEKAGERTTERRQTKRPKPAVVDPRSSLSG